jgi:uracil-DNA glycosylase
VAIKKEDILAALVYQKEIGIHTLLADDIQNRFEEVNVQPTKKQPTIARSTRSQEKADKSNLIEQAQEQAAACATLEELHAALYAFSGGDDLKAGAKNCVFSDGNPQAHTMLIGEAPGKDEDDQGLPFVGRSGQLLEKILNAIGLSRNNKNAQDSVYISNVIPWRPPANRTPTDAETAMFLPFVQKHVMLIQPKVLIFAGGTSAKIMLATKTGIKSLRGNWHNWSASDLHGKSFSCPAMPTLHPAYLLRNAVDKRLVWQDMLMLKEKLNAYQ